MPKIEDLNESERDRAKVDKKGIVLSGIELIYIKNVKICNVCGEIKLISEFHNDIKLRDGKCNVCKECRRIKGGYPKKNIRHIADYDGFPVYGSAIYPTISVNNKTMRFHIYLMEKKLGRKLEKGECVHHIDGNRYNWNIKNLQLMTKSEHHSLESFKMNKRNGNIPLILICKYCGKQKKYSKSYYVRHKDRDYKCAVCRSKYKICHI